MLGENIFTGSQLFTVSAQEDVLATTLGMKPRTRLISPDGKSAVFIHMVCSGRVTAIRRSDRCTVFRCDRCELHIMVPDLVRTVVDLIHMAEKKFPAVRRVA